jgi:hypothetical protein
LPKGHLALLNETASPLQRAAIVYCLSAFTAAFGSILVAKIYLGLRAEALAANLKG